MPNKIRLETPLWKKDDEVYEPSEDSFLLLDTLEKDLPMIVETKPSLVLEVGSGSGIIVTALAKALASTAFFLAVDISPSACTTTFSTASLNSAMVEVVQDDLAACLECGRGLIDLLVFNPPYVVTPPNEVNSGSLISRSWAGGVKGRQVTDRLLHKLPHLMSQHCLGYIVAIDENIPEEICDILDQLGFKGAAVCRRTVPGEKLSIIRFTRK